MIKELGPFVAIVLVGFVIWFAYERAKIQKASWREACLNPFWEVQEYTMSGETWVHLVLAARSGRRYESFGKPDFIGTADIQDPDWQLQLEGLRVQAESRARVLNDARNRRSG